MAESKMVKHSREHAQCCGQVSDGLSACIEKWWSCPKRRFHNILQFQQSDSLPTDGIRCNLVPRVLRLFGQRLVTRRDSGELEFYYRRISAVMQAVTRKPIKTFNFSNSPESFLATNRWSKNLGTLGTRLYKVNVDVSVLATQPPRAKCNSYPLPRENLS